MASSVIIIGAGPAGLTAALELARKSDIRPVVLESLDDVGGISRTIEYHGNRMDIGGHRFFSKNDWVMRWWQNMMPLAPDMDQNSLSILPKGDDFFLIRSRLSRIYFLRKFFDYPISISLSTLKNLGGFRLIKIGVSYLWAMCFPRRPEVNLEDFFHNRFGVELYKTFFKDYTEKVWGVPCAKISSAWGAQRIKGLSITRALLHACKKIFGFGGGEIGQKNTETSLIERFLYPKLGPGQMWRKAADELISLGGAIHYGQRVQHVEIDGGRIVSVTTVDSKGVSKEWRGEWFVSTMPVRDFVQACSPQPPVDVVSVAKGLVYRDFITMGVLLNKMSPNPSAEVPHHILPDTWIYIQEPDVKIGRLQIFNNWSPALVADPSKTWIGLEYFCQEGDELWNLSDSDFSALAVNELEKIGLAKSEDVLDWHVVRVPKAYPAYFGSYDNFDVVREWFDSIPNVFPIGRNGMHRYNNQDHSMLTAKLAAELILDAGGDKSHIWAVNSESEYHEEVKK